MEGRIKSGGKEKTKKITSDSRKKTTPYKPTKPKDKDVIMDIDSGTNKSSKNEEEKSATKEPPNDNSGKTIIVDDDDDDDDDSEDTVWYIKLIEVTVEDINTIIKEIVTQKGRKAVTTINSSESFIERGQAFIAFMDKDARDALKDMNLSCGKVDNNTTEITPEQSKIYFRAFFAIGEDIKEEMSDDEMIKTLDNLQNCFEEIGLQVQISISVARHATVYFKNFEDWMKAYSIHQFVDDDNILYRQVKHLSTTNDPNYARLYISDLPPNCQEKHVFKLFKKNKIQAFFIAFLRNRKTNAPRSSMFLYTTRNDLEKALSMNNNPDHTLKRKTIRVEIAQQYKKKK